MLRTCRATAVALVLLLCALATTASAQIELFVQGASQGPIEPQAVPGPEAERRMLMPIPLQSFSVSVSQYYDPNDPSVPIGPRQAGPLNFTKLIDATSTKFLHALADWEELTTCFLHVLGPDGLGGTRIILEITLTGARVMSSFAGFGFDGALTESLSLEYETLEWYNPITGERFTETMGPSAAGPQPAAPLALTTSPNPSSGETQFSFRIPASGDVSIDVYDFRGRHVATIFDGAASASEGGVVSWNGRDASGQPVASGVYMVRMQAGGWLTTHKMSVLR